MGIVEYFYIPFGVFISSISCAIATGILYYYKKNEGFSFILLHCISLIFISFIYVYPFNVLVNREYYLKTIALTLFILYYPLAFSVQTVQNIGNVMVNIYLYITSKTVLLLCSILLYWHDIPLYLLLMMVFIGTRISIMMVGSKHNCIPLKHQSPHSERFILVVMVTIIAYSTHQYVHGSIYTFLLISVLNIVFVIYYLVRTSNNLNDTHVKDQKKLQFYDDKKYNKIIKQVKEHIEEHYNLPIDRYTVALHCEMHPDYVSRIFKGFEGITITRYIQYVRLVKAYDLLINSEKKIIEIAYDVGYTNLATFYRHFKNQYKKAPQELRKTNARIINNEFYCKFVCE